MFDIPGMSAPTPDFLELLEERVEAIFESHGLVRSTDASGGSGGGPFALLADLEAPGSKYDDSPAIEKLIAAVANAAKKTKQTRSSTFRLLGCNPGDCSAMILVAGTFTPLLRDDAADLDRLPQWCLSVRAKSDESGRQSVRDTFSGDVMDYGSLRSAFGMITTICDRLQRDHNLQPKPRPSSPFGGFSAAPMPLVAEG